MQTYARFRPDRIGRPQQMAVSKPAQDHLGLLPGVRVRAELLPDDLLVITPDRAGPYTVMGNLKNQRVVLSIQDVFAPAHAREPLSAEPLRADIEGGALRVHLRDVLSPTAYRALRFRHQWNENLPLAETATGRQGSAALKTVAVGLPPDELAAHRAAADAASLTVPMYLRALIADGLEYRDQHRLRNVERQEPGLIAMYQAGLSFEDIGAALGIGAKAVELRVAELVREGRLARRPRIRRGRYAVDEQEMQTIVQLYQEGRTHEEISAETGRSIPTILDRLKLAGVPLDRRASASASWQSAGADGWPWPLTLADVAERLHGAADAPARRRTQTTIRVWRSAGYIERDGWARYDRVDARRRHRT